MHYEALEQLTRERLTARATAAAAERLATEARGRRQTRRRRRALAATLERLYGRHAATHLRTQA